MTSAAALPWRWPLIVKVPALVTLFMVAVSAILTHQVLRRLEATQTTHFEELTAAYLDGLTSSLIPAVLRQDPWETFDILDRARNLYRGLDIRETVVAGADGMVLAASDPRRVPAYGEVPAHILGRFAAAGDLWMDETGEQAGVRRILLYQGRPIGSVYARFDVADLFGERRAVLWTLIGLNSAIAFLLAAAAYFSVRRLLRPIHTLTRHLHEGAHGIPSPIPIGRYSSGRSEFAEIFARFNGLVAAMQERKALTERLAEEEKIASLGRMASGMAHEINNPLGGLFNAVATLKSHGESAQVRANALGLIERGLIGIRDVVRTTLAVYRADRSARNLAPADIDDLRLLIAPEARRHCVVVTFHNNIPAELPVPSAPVRQSVLNLLLNAVAASPEGAEVSLDAVVNDEELVLSVRDRGAGLQSAGAEILTDPFSAPPLRGGGLGLWATRRMITELSGSITVQRPHDGGTLIRVSVPLRRVEGLADVA
jgi:signal transduction histidine kinase